MKRRTFFSLTALGILSTLLPKTVFAEELQRLQNRRLSNYIKRNMDRTAKELMFMDADKACKFGEQEMSRILQELTWKKTIQEFKINCKYDMKIGGFEMDIWYRPYGSVVFTHIHMDVVRQPATL